VCFVLNESVSLVVDVFNEHAVLLGVFSWVVFNPPEYLTEGEYSIAHIVYFVENGVDILDHILTVVCGQTRDKRILIDFVAEALLVVIRATQPFPTPADHFV